MATATVTTPAVTVQRHYDAPPANVYAAWTRADMIVGWFGPTDAVKASVQAKMDVRPGGRFTISFAREGGGEVCVSGLYKEVVPNERLVFGWAWSAGSGHESQVTVSTKAEGNGTLLTLKHEQLLDQSAAEAHRRGWIGSLDKLAALLERERA